MILREYPFLVSKPLFCKIMGISRWTLRMRLSENAYPLLKWVNDSGTLKVVRSSVERQLESMMVQKAA